MFYQKDAEDVYYIWYLGFNRMKSEWSIAIHYDVEFVETEVLLIHLCYGHSFFQSSGYYAEVFWKFWKFRNVEDFIDCKEKAI